MKTAPFLAAIFVLTLFAGERSVRAEGWSLEKLNPFAKQEPAAYSAAPVRFGAYANKKEPSPLEKFNAGTQKILADTTAGTKKVLVGTANGTKKFFTGVRDTFAWKDPAPKRKANPLVPWIREPEDPRYLRSSQKQKKSWFDSLFGREEPRRVESMKDWVGLPRPEF